MIINIKPKHLIILVIILSSAFAAYYFYYKSKNSVVTKKSIKSQYDSNEENKLKLDKAAGVEIKETYVKITAPKVGEWVYYQGGPLAGPTARQIVDADVVLNIKSYQCSLGIVKEDRIAYKRYATKEEIEVAQPLK